MADHNFHPLALPLNKRAREALKAFGAKIESPGMPATDLLLWAMEHDKVQSEVRGAKAMMWEHLEMHLQALDDPEAAAYLFGEEKDLDPGSDPEAVLQTLLDMLHLRMTENVEGYPPMRSLP